MIPLSEESLSTLSDFLAEQMGLHFPPNRWRDLERGIASAAHEFDFTDAQACIKWLLSTRLSKRQIEVLSSYLTVGETYFFREKRIFEVLQQDVLPELIRSRRENGHRLRIWSAGCCTGEEPYSIAILLDQLIHDIQNWNITILGTDINPRFLQKAGEALYSQWSFHDTPSWIQERYFRKTKDGRFRILPELKKRVVFSYLNLAEDSYPSLLNNTNAIDLVLCRNVLMYFSAASGNKVIEKLHRSLMEEGWLIVSPTEASTVLFSQFQSVSFPGAVLYRRAAGNIQTLRPFELPPMVATAPTPAEIACSTSPEPAGRRRYDAAALARTCANEGKIEEARRWIDQAIQQDKLNPAFHYLRATILQEEGEIDESVGSLKRALYLDPNFVLGHFTLATLYARTGKSQESARHFNCALSLLGMYAKEDVLPEGEGLTAGRLIEIIESSMSFQEMT